MRRFNQFSIYRILVGADQQEVKWAIERWSQKDSFNTSFRTFMFVLQVTANVIKLIPWVRKASQVLGLMLELMDFVLWLYEWSDPPRQITRSDETNDLLSLDAEDQERLKVSLESILDSLRSK